MKKRLMFVTVGLTIPFLFACAEEEIVPPVESISLNKTKLTLNIGEEFALKAVAKPLEATQEFIWKSAEPNAVHVVGGMLHAYSIPTTHDDGGDYTTITVSNYAKDKKDLKTASCKVYVTNIPHDDSLIASGISISKSYVEMEIGDTAEVLATVTPIGLTNEDKEVEWTLSEGGDAVVNLVENFQPDSTAATFAEKNSSKVTLTALAAGNAVLTAKDKKTGEFSGQCAIKVNPEPEVVHVESIAFDQDTLYIEQGKTGQNDLTIIPWAAENKEIEYESSDESIATVDSNGVVSVKADATIGDSVTITATSVDGSKTDSFTVIVSEHHSNYLWINQTSNPGWKASEMSLKSGDESEYHIASIDLDVGDEFVFCTGVDAGNEKWHHFDQIKSGEGSAKNCFSSKDGNILCNRGGTFEIYVQSDPAKCDWEGEGDDAVMKSIWITAKSLDPLPDVTMTLVHNGTPSAPEVLSHAGTGEQEYGFTGRTFEAGDEIIFNYGGLTYGLNEVKEGGASALAKQGTTSTNHIKFEATLSYDIFIDMGADDHGKRIWIASNYVQKYTASTETWSYQNVGINPEEHKENEFLLSNYPLEVGDKLLFNVANGYYKFNNIKPNCEAAAGLSTDDDWNIVVDVAGTYTFYVMTPNTYGHEEGIWVAASAPEVVSQLLVKGGSPIELSAKSMTEYDVLAQTVSKDTEFVATIGGTIYSFEDLKVAHPEISASGGASNLFIEGSAYDASHHYIKATQSLKYDIYVNTAADDFGDHIYITSDYMMIYTSEWTYTDIAATDPAKPTEFVATGVSLAYNNKVLFYLNDNYYHYENLKTDSRIYSTFSADGDGNIVIRNTCTYDFYIETADGPKDGDNPRLVIWTSCPPEANPNYSINIGTSSPRNWYLNDGANVYAWAFNGNGDHKWIKGTEQGNGESRSIVFTIPGIYTGAAFFRVGGTITNVNNWEGINDVTVYNRTADTTGDIVLTGHTGGIIFNLE